MINYHTLFARTHCCLLSTHCIYYSFRLISFYPCLVERPPNQIEATLTRLLRDIRYHVNVIRNRPGDSKLPIRPSLDGNGNACPSRLFVELTTSRQKKTSILYSVFLLCSLLHTTSHSLLQRLRQTPFISMTNCQLIAFLMLSMGHSVLENTPNIFPCLGLPVQ